MPGILRSSVCIRRQADLLGHLRARGLWKLDSLTAAVHEHDGEADRSLVVRWASGERTAPLGLLWVLLEHCGAAAVLAHVAADYGLRVVEDARGHAPQGADLAGEALDVLSAAADVAKAVRAATADGRVSPEEADSILRSCEDVRAQLADVEQLVRPLARRSGR